MSPRYLAHPTRRVLATIGSITLACAVAATPALAGEPASAAAAADAIEQAAAGAAGQPGTDDAAAGETAQADQPGGTSDVARPGPTDGQPEGTGQADGAQGGGQLDNAADQQDAEGEGQGDVQDAGAGDGMPQGEAPSDGADGQQDGAPESGGGQDAPGSPSDDSAANAPEGEGDQDRTPENGGGQGGADEPAASPGTDAQDEGQNQDAQDGTAENAEGQGGPDGTTLAPETNGSQERPADPSPLPEADENLADDAAGIETRADSVYAGVSSDGSSITLKAAGGTFAKAWGVSFEVRGSNGTGWFAATRQSDGSWTCTLPATSVGSGSFTAVGWANIAADPATSVASATSKVPSVEASLSLRYDGASGKLVVEARGVSCPTGVSFISTGITSPGGATKWYRLIQQPDGNWSVEVDPADFGWESGTYTVAGSICDLAWKGNPAGSVSAQVSFGSEELAAQLTAGGATTSIVASGGRYALAWNVSFEITGSRGTSWVAGVRQPDGSWKAEVSSAGMGSGAVRINAWANVGNDPASKIGSTTSSVPATNADLSLSYSAQTGKLVASAQNVTCPTGVTFISVGVTSPAGTQRWYRLEQRSDGSWAASIDPGDFSWAGGAYTIAGSICDASWTGIDVGSKRADISFGSESVSASASSDATVATFTASGGRASQAWNVSFEVRNAAGKTTWVAATRQADGSWKASGDAAGWGGGVLTATAWACIGERTINIGSASVRTYSATPEVTAVTRSASSDILVTASGGAFHRAANVSFSIYNLSEGEGQTAWFQAYKQPDGSWAAEVPAAVNGVGTCVVKAWATVDGATGERATTRYTYSVVPRFTTEIYLGGGDYSVSYGMAGLKVQRVQQALGIGDYNYPRYLDQTVSAVSSFQTRVGLPATGIVDRSTWLALGLDSNEWYTLGAYASPVQVSSTASASQRIEAMIGRAYDYLGDSYVWDAAGAPGQGVDCAGLVMQSLYAAGVDTGIINPVTHSSTSWGDHDASNFYHYGGFSKVALNDRKRGDLIYYGSGGVIDHIAIYLGNNQIIEAYPNSVRISSLFKSTIIGVDRVFS